MKNTLQNEEKKNDFFRIAPHNSDIQYCLYRSITNPINGRKIRAQRTTR